jgi:uncharacterized DUF497 family protein
MQFEWDDDKSAVNHAKHGIAFDAARALWDDERLLQVPARTADEARFLVIGLIDGRHWAAVWTPRGEKIRLISCRRARIEEVERYESA